MNSIKTEKIRDIWVIKLLTKSLNFPEAAQLQNAYSQLKIIEMSYIILDLTYMDTINSNGIGCVLVLWRSATNEHKIKDFILVTNNQILIEMFKLKGPRLFSSFDEALVYCNNN